MTIGELLTKVIDAIVANTSHIIAWLMVHLQKLGA